MIMYTVPFLAALLLVCLQVKETFSLAGRGQRRRSRNPAAVEYNTATATTLDPDDKRDLQILWGMAGQTSRRKQKSGRKATRILGQDKTNYANLGNDNIKKDEKPRILSADIQSVTIDSPLQATIALVNGTTYSTNPRDFDQDLDFDIWMRARQQLDISASELSSLMNNSYFSTPKQLLEKKTKPQKPITRPTSKACQWGLKMEPQALRQYRQVTGFQVEETGMWIHQHDDDGSSLLMGASPDGIVYDSTTDTSGLLEIKSLWGRRHKKELPQFDHCPTRFWDQIQGQLAACDKEWCDLMLYIPPSNKHRRNYCILRVERNREYWDKELMPRVKEFCNKVRAVKKEAAAAEPMGVE